MKGMSENPRKSTYDAPRVIDLGSIEDITRTGTGTGATEKAAKKT
jgi:hypothetical protein